MFEYKNIKINYDDSKNEKEITLVYLHGWGQNIEMMLPIAKPFKKDYRVIIIDLPGFGKSEEPKSVWSIDDYALMVKTLLDSLNISNPIIIGHSFGGKIGIAYASLYETKKLVLLASPYKKSQKVGKKRTNVLKKMRFIPGIKKLENYFKKRVGSLDYRNASPLMRDILVKHISTDYVDRAKMIKCPTLLIWGSYDQAVSLSDAYDLEKLIDDAGLIVYQNATHYAYLEHKDEVLKVLECFFK